MADRIMLQFGANTGDVDRALDKTADNLDKTKDALDEVGRAGEEAGQSTADGLEAAGDGLTDVGDSATDASGRLGELGEVGKQALEGDVGGAAVSAAQLLSAFGGAGVLAGTLASAGINLVTDALEQQEKKAEEVRQRLVGMYKDAAEEGRAFIDQAAIDATVLDLLYGTEEEIAQRKEEAAQIGVDYITYVRAQAGDYEALQYAIEQAEEAERKRQALFGGGGGNSEGAVYDETLDKIQNVKNDLQGISNEHDKNRTSLEQYNAYSAQVSEEQREQIDRTKDADQKRYEAAADYIAKLNGEEVTVPVKFSVNKQSVENYIADLKRRNIPIVADVVDRYGRSLD